MESTATDAKDLMPVVAENPAAAPPPTTPDKPAQPVAERSEAVVDGVEPPLLEFDNRTSERKRRMRERQRQADEKRRRAEAQRLEAEIQEEARRNKRRAQMMQRKKAEAKRRKEMQDRGFSEREIFKGEKTAKQLEIWAQKRVDTLMREQEKIKMQLDKAAEDVRIKRAALEATRYPIDDRLLVHEGPMESLAERPVPVKRLPIEASLATEAVVVWDFLRQFSGLLNLSPYSLDEFLDMVQVLSEPSVLLSETLCTLTRILLSDKSILYSDELSGDTMASEFLPRKVPVSLADHLSYGEVLRNILPLTSAFELMSEGVSVEATLTADGSATPQRASIAASRHRTKTRFDGTQAWLGPALHRAINALAEKETHEMPAEDKIALLRCVCNAAYETSTIRNAVAHNLEERTKICKKREEEEREERRAERLLKSTLQERAISELAPADAADGEDGSAAGGEGSSKEAANPPKKKKKNHGVAQSVIQARAEELMLAEKLGKRYLVAPMEDDGPAEADGEETEDEDEETLMLKLTRREMLERRQRKDKIAHQKRIREENRLMHAEAKEMLLSAAEASNIRALKDAIKYAVMVGLEEDFEDGDSRAIPDSDSNIIYDAKICPELFEARKALLALEDRKKKAERRKRYEQELSQLGIRTEPLGEDRDGRLYYLFQNDDRVYVQEPQPTLVVEEEKVQPSPSVISLDKTDPKRVQTVWLYYDTEAETLQLVRSLDVRGIREKALKEALQAEFDVKVLVQSVEATKGEDVEWKTEGHEFLGRRVRRKFGKQGTMDGTVTGWLPAEENEGLELWHIKHDDGDNEDLDLEELTEAMKVHEEAASAQESPVAKKAEGGGSGESGTRPSFNYRNKLRRDAPQSEFHVGLGGLKQRLIDCERDQILPKLHDLRSEFANSRSTERRVWMDLLLNAARVQDISQVLIQLEDVIHGLQEDEDMKDDDTEEEDEDKEEEEEPEDEDEDYETESETEAEAGTSRSSRRKPTSRASTPVEVELHAATLWPHANARERWRNATIKAKTTSQAALSFRCLMDHAIDFGAALKETDSELGGRISRSRRKQQQRQPDAKKLAPKWH